MQTATVIAAEIVTKAAATPMTTILAVLVLMQMLILPPPAASAEVSDIEVFVDDDVIADVISSPRLPPSDSICQCMRLSFYQAIICIRAFKCPAYNFGVCHLVAHWVKVGNPEHLQIGGSYHHHHWLKNFCICLPLGAVHWLPGY